MPLAKNSPAPTLAPDRPERATHTSTTASAAPPAAPSAAAPSAAPPPAEARPARTNDAEIHLLRLCLDLQLDAMLLELGAAVMHGDSTTAGHSDAPPWNRWVREDLTLVHLLAGDVKTGKAALPALLGSELDQAVAAAAIDNLIARYESMSALLADVLPPDGSGDPAPHRAHAQEALGRYQDRLRELRNTRLDATPPRGLALSRGRARAAGSQLFSSRPVPGEWLG